MIRLLELLRKSARTLLFIFLELCAIFLYAHSSGYAQARVITAANSLTGSVYRVFYGAYSFMWLGRENRALLESNTELRNRITDLESGTVRDSLNSWGESPMPYYYTSAKVIRNSISRKDNFFVINKGAKDGLAQDMAILTPSGEIAGYIVNAGRHFSVCMSMLNSAFSMGGALKDKDYFGFLQWNGEDYRHIILNDIPVYADIQKGDTIRSTVSYRFPPDMTIGTVADFKVSENTTNYDIKVRLATDFSRLRNVIVSDFKYADELSGIERALDETQNAEKQ